MTLPAEGRPVGVAFTVVVPVYNEEENVPAPARACAK